MSPAHRARRLADPRQRQIVTPEGLSLSFTLASRGARVGALLLDLLFLFLAVLAITVVLGFTASGLGKLGLFEPSHREGLEFLVVTWMAALFVARNGWFLAFELGPRGATPGKRILGIRIAARDGARLGATRVIARNLLRDVEIFVPLTLLAALGQGDSAAGWIAAGGWVAVFTCLPLWNRDAMRAGDLVGGTWVVEAPRLRLAVALSAPASPDARTPADGDEGRGSSAPLPARHSYRFGEAELAVYGEFELQTLERVLREGRVEALPAVAAVICAKIGWTPPSDDEARVFLSDYYTQLRARLEAGMRLGQRKADKFSGPDQAIDPRDGPPVSGAGAQ